MALAETAKLVVNLSLAGNFSSQLSKAGKGLDTFGAKVDKTESRAYRAGQQIGTGIKNSLKVAAVGVGLLASQVALGLRSLVDLEEQTAQTNAVIKSTGGVAGVTATQVRKLAEQYESLNATIGDEVIQQGENLLLTFTAIRKDAFEPALKASLNLATALHTDLQSAVKVVGKALSDPAKAIAKLNRLGIVLTKNEQKQIQAHLDNNDALGAQNVILKALDDRYGGSFLAKGNTTAGKVAKFTDSIEDLQRALAEALLPTIGNIADELSAFLQDPEVVRGIHDLGEDIAGLFSKENIREGARVIGTVFETLRKAAPAIRSALSTVGNVLSTAFDAFNSLDPNIQQLLIGGFAVNRLTNGLVTNIAGGIFGALKAMTVQAGVVNVTGGVVNGGGGVGGGGVGGGSVAGKVAIGATIVGGLALSAESINDLAQKNAEYAARGLNPAETAAIRYYQASAADQSFMAKHLGRVPTKADYDSALAKLAGSSRKDKDDIIATTKKSSSTATAKAEAAKAAVTAVQQSVDRDRADTVARLGSVRSQTAQSGSSIVSAIYANRPIITTTVNVSATTVTKVTNVQRNYGNPVGSRASNPNASQPD